MPRAVPGSPALHAMSCVSSWMYRSRVELDLSVVQRQRSSGGLSATGLLKDAITAGTVRLAGVVQSTRASPAAGTEGG